MKTIIFTFCFCFTAIVASAQLKVSGNGYTGIGITGTPLSLLSVGTTGNAYHKSEVEGNVVAMYLRRSGDNPYSSGYWGTALRTSSAVSSTRGDIGIQIYIGSATPLSSGRTIGITGSAYNATSGYNYGVIGHVGGSNNGTGILGTSDTNGEMGLYIDGRYAGYFKGDVKVTGTINGVVVGNSDVRYKKNIAALDEDDALKKILQLKPVSYNLNQVYLEPQTDTLTIKQGLFNENSQEFQKKHFGLIAQDLKELYPNLVYEDNNGYLSINYIEIIPLLIQSVQELKQEVNQLTSDPVKRIAAGETISSEILQATLYQNAPNPFSQSTIINYYLPVSVNKALLCIYDLQGKQLKQMVLTQRGNGSETIYGSQLPAGIYHYALIADGKEVDIKRMILTK